MEKLKDYLYDISDLLLALGLILIIVFTLSYKITDAFTIKLFASEQKPTEFIDKITDSSLQTNVQTPVEVEPTTPVIEEPKEEVIVSGTPIKFSISSGSSGYSIAKTLQEKNLINDINEFLKRVEELKLGSKLRSGEFTINSGTSLDDVIYIITGKKK
jgi:hypothetical protein